MHMQRLPAVGPASAGDIVRDFVPTRRFARVSFDSYEPDPRYPSQQRALDRLRWFAKALEPPSNPIQRVLGRRPKVPKGIYLDGGYGVGKTHLLAATYHATQ